MDFPDKHQINIDIFFFLFRTANHRLHSFCFRFAAIFRMGGLILKLFKVLKCRFHLPSNDKNLLGAVRSMYQTEEKNSFSCYGIKTKYQDPVALIFKYLIKYVRI